MNYFPFREETAYLLAANVIDPGFLGYAGARSEQNFWITKTLLVHSRLACLPFSTEMKQAQENKQEDQDNWRISECRLRVHMCCSPTLFPLRHRCQLRYHAKPFSCPRVSDLPRFQRAPAGNRLEFMRNSTVSEMSWKVKNI